MMFIAKELVVDQSIGNKTYKVIPEKVNDFIKRNIPEVEILSCLEVEEKYQRQKQ